MGVRDYMRVDVAGLKVRYNCLSIDDSSSLYLEFGKRKSKLTHDSCEEGDSFQSTVTSALHRLEIKLDELIGYLEREKHGTGYQYTGTVVDISGGGLQLRGPCACPVGTLLDLCIFTVYGNNRPLYAIGRVCWAEDAEMEAGAEGATESVLGIQFVEISEEAREILVRMVFHVERKRRQQETQSDQ